MTQKGDNNDRQEDFAEKVAAVLEGFDMFAKKLEDIVHEIHEMKKDFGFQLETIKDSIVSFKDETNANFESVREYLSRIDDEIQSIKTDVKDIKSSLEKKADHSRLIKLEARLTSVEKELKKYRSRLD